MRRQRGLSYALITAAAGVVGLLLLRAPFSSESLTADFLSNRYVFIYLFTAVAATFLGLGDVLSANRPAAPPLVDGRVDGFM